MSFPDPPPSPFMQPPVGGFWPQLPINSEYLDTHSQFEHAPPFKRQRNFESYPSNSSAFPPVSRMNPPNLPVNKGTSNIFFKTRICAKFLEGSCRNGENCTFAHGFDDLREPPPNWQDLVREKDRGSGNWVDDHRITHRMKICRKFYSGEECPYGDKCNFLHRRSSEFKEEIPRSRESSAISIGTTGPIIENPDQSETNKQVNVNSDAFRANMKPAYWKTKLCSKWEITGLCPFGDRCHFAHGLSELHAPGSNVEAEVMPNACSTLIKPLCVPLNDDSPTTTLVGAPTVEEREGKKFLFKWKGNKKINDIYGDWIDDQLPPHSLSNVVES